MYLIDRRLRTLFLTELELAVSSFRYVKRPLKFKKTLRSQLGIALRRRGHFERRTIVERECQESGVRYPTTSLFHLRKKREKNRVKSYRRRIILYECTPSKFDTLQKHYTHYTK